MIAKRSVRHARARLSAPAALLLFAVIGSCGTTSSTSPSSASSATDVPAPSTSDTDPVSGGGSLVIVGRIVTMDDPPIAEALLIEEGVVSAIGSRDDVLAQADDEVPVIEIGDDVAYPGFIDAHAHWIGDRDYYGIDTPAAAMDAASSRGWTSISEQWINPEKLDLLTGLATDGALPLRVDAYLALNFDKEFFGDWYESREPGAFDDRLRVKGLKIHLDDGMGNIINWEPAELTATIGRADEAGWQVSVHAMSTDAMELVLDAFEAALGPTGPNPLHHRIEHAIQISDEQLARMVAMDVATVIHLEGAADWLGYDEFLVGFDRDDAGDEGAWIARWRDFVDAGLHVASATDAPWTFQDFKLTDDIGRPVDQIAAGMDGQVRESPETPPYLLDQLLTAEQALRAVTADAAWALGDEARRGRLAPGTLGDVTILSGDVTAATPGEIRAMTVIATIVGGSPVYCDGSDACSQLSD
jgi:predicted amidohydrolase YtcJ